MRTWEREDYIVENDDGLLDEFEDYDHAILCAYSKAVNDKETTSVSLRCQVLSDYCVEAEERYLEVTFEYDEDDDKVIFQGAEDKNTLEALAVLGANDVRSSTA